MTVSLFHPNRPIGASKPVGLLELKAESCRWPLTSAAPWTYCGLQRERGAYCSTHGAIAYRDEANRKPRP